MAVTRDHVAAVYGKLGQGPRLSRPRTEGAARALKEYYFDLTDAAARILAHHLWRVHLEHPETRAADAIEAIGHDLGMEGDHAAAEGDAMGGALLGGGLGDWLKKVGRVAAKAAKKAAPALLGLAKEHAAKALEQGRLPTKQEAVDALKEAAAAAVAAQHGGAMLGGRKRAGLVRRGHAAQQRGGRLKIDGDFGGALLGGALPADAAAAQYADERGGNVFGDVVRGVAHLFGAGEEKPRKRAHRAAPKRAHRAPKGGAPLGGALLGGAREMRPRGMTLLDSLRK